MRAMRKPGASRRTRRLAVGLVATALSTAGLVSGARPAAAAPSSDFTPSYYLYIASYLPGDVTYVTVSWVGPDNYWTASFWPTIPCRDGRECAITDGTIDASYGSWPYVPGQQPVVQAYKVYGAPASLPVTTMTGHAGYFSGDYYVCNLYSPDAQDAC